MDDLWEMMAVAVDDGPAWCEWAAEGQDGC